MELETAAAPSFPTTNDLFDFVFVFRGVTLVLRFVGVIIAIRVVDVLALGLNSFWPG
jgi:hypothetical protein